MRPGPDVVIADEAHTIKDPKAKINISISRIGNLLCHACHIPAFLFLATVAVVHSFKTFFNFVITFLWHHLLCVIDIYLFFYLTHFVGLIYFFVLFFLFQSSATLRRIALTGSPLQNNLEEYWCMVNWVKPRFLGELKEFRKRFIDPIKEGEIRNASKREVGLMKKRAFVLHKKLMPLIDRKDLSTLAKDLKPKREFVVSIKMSDFQQFMYKQFLLRLSESQTNKKVQNVRCNILFESNFLLTHPRRYASLSILLSLSLFLSLPVSLSLSVTHSLSHSLTLSHSLSISPLLASLAPLLFPITAFRSISGSTSPLESPCLRRHVVT